MTTPLSMARLARTMVALLAGLVLVGTSVAMAAQARPPACTQIVWSGAFDEALRGYPAGCQDGDGYLLTPQSAQSGSDGSPTPGDVYQYSKRAIWTDGRRYYMRDSDGDGYSVKRDGQAIFRNP